MRRPVVVVGAGIIGLAVAFTLLRQRPGVPLIVLDKEARVAAHQTGHNSGVIHSGVYYRPGSWKARLCLSGRNLLLDYLRSHDIPFRICGKVIVATRPSELAPLAELGRRAQENGVPNLRFLDPEELRRLEPEVGGTSALHVPGTGIVDYTRVTESLAEEVRRLGGTVRTGRAVEGVERVGDGVSITTHEETLEASFLVNAAGLYADRLARMTGFDPPCRIVPFRGEYYTLAPRARGLVNGLVYPVPDPDLPFLGVHVTPHIDGSVEVGPNAVLALAREGYRKTDVDARDLMGTLLYPGFLRMARRYWRTSLHEMRRSLSTRVFAEDLRRLVPRLGVADMAPGGAGVRAQAIGRGGELIDDFLLVDRPHALHILNAPSPAATSSLAIAEHVVGRIPALSA